MGLPFNSYLTDAVGFLGVPAGAWAELRGWGSGVEVAFEHNGTAAGMVYAGMRDTAVIMVGTALGFGFPREDEVGLCGLDLGFEVVRDEC